MSKQPGKAPKRKKGFACLTPERVRQIARLGGKAAQAGGKAHKFTAANAKEAGRRGGVAAHKKGVAHQYTSEEARKAAKKRRQT